MRPFVSRLLPALYLLLSLKALLLGTVLASSGTSSSILAPIRHFEPSWAASCAQGTAVALRFQDSMVILIRSPSSNLWRPPVTQRESPPLLISNLAVRPLVGKSLAQFAPSWLSVGPHSLCAMTGLASDVEHLFRVLQKQVDAHWNIRDEHATTHSMTVDLADTFQQEIFAGSRPFGVQCLLVGSDDYDPDRKYCVYTIDPSGNWQSWGGATAIGKYAATVREELAKKRQTSSPSSLKEALEIMVDCWMETCKKQNINLHMEDDYQVLILQNDHGVSKFYAVMDEEVDSIVQKAVASNTK